MTIRDRVYAALAHQQTDIVPYQIDFTVEALEKVIDYYHDADIASHIGNHLANAMYDIYRATHTEVCPGYFRDHFGVIWNRTVDQDIGMVEGLCLPRPTLDGYQFPTVDAEFYRAIYRPFIAVNPCRFRFGAIGFSLFERAWTLRGMDNLLADMLEYPAFVDELLDRILAYNLQAIRVALEFDIDAVHFGDDWGQQQGTIMGPSLWRRFIKPRLAEMYALVKGAGKYVSQHSCGDVQTLFPDLIEIGLDIFNTFQPEIMDVAAMKREYGHDLTFWGGISTQRVLPFGTPEEVAANVRNMCALLGAGGGYICAPTHDVPRDVPIANLVALIETLRSQRT